MILNFPGSPAFSTNPRGQDTKNPPSSDSTCLAVKGPDMRDKETSSARYSRMTSGLSRADL